MDWAGGLCMINLFFTETRTVTSQMAARRSRRSWTKADQPPGLPLSLTISGKDKQWRLHIIFLRASYTHDREIQKVPGWKEMEYWASAPWTFSRMALSILLRTF